MLALKNLKLNLLKSQSVKSSINGTIKALGEADFVIDAPFSAKSGSELAIESSLIQDVLGDKKTYIVTRSNNGASNTTNISLTLTMLGLKNEDLQKIRSTILHWDKL